MDERFERRYARNISIPEIGKEGQEKLLGSSVFILGAGALGSFAAMMLAGAGVGHIGIADFDTVDESNLQRQIFYGNSHLGLHKLDVLEKRIRDLNPFIKVTTIHRLIRNEDAIDLFSEFDFIIDGSDNVETKKMTDSVCNRLCKPCCIAGVREFSGQVATFIPGSTRYSDIFPEVDSEGMLPCSVTGVVAPAVGVAASHQACEAIKYLCNAGEILSGSLYSFNLLTNFHTVIRL